MFVNVSIKSGSSQKWPAHLIENLKIAPQKIKGGTKLLKCQRFGAAFVLE